VVSGAVPSLPATPTAIPAVPVVVPNPPVVVIPTLTSSGEAVLAAIRSDRTATWVKNHTETSLRSGPDAASMVFTQLPQWSTLKQIDSRPDWLLVEYGGDGETRLPGPGWVTASDVGRVDAPAVWLASGRWGTVWSSSSSGAGAATRIVDVPPLTLMEVGGPDPIQGARVSVRLPGDGRLVPPSQGWVDAEVLARVRAPSTLDLPWAYPEALRADVRIHVPYRTQLDGSDYAGSNCGPTVLGMALELFGVNLTPTVLRGDVLSSEEFDPTDTDAGAYIWALAQVAQSHGLAVHGLYDDAGAATTNPSTAVGMHRWSLDEIRDSVRHKRPVIAQVVYRGLPGREDSGYYGDHYIIVTGLVGEDFLYNDPIGGPTAHEAPGYDRLMTPTQLRRAMRASDTPYANTAFAVSGSQTSDLRSQTR
jgi:hypothetical protein